MYDLRTFGSGFCHTYDPPEPSPPDFDKRLLMFLGDVRTRVKESNINSFIVYIHEKGQFWPRPGMAFIGQSEPIILNLNSEVDATFSIQKRKTLNTPERSCTDVPGYSFTRCLRDFVEKSSGCKICWRMTNTKEDDCRDNQNMSDYYYKLLHIQRSSIKNIIQQSGCLPKCQVTKYLYQEVSKERVAWARNWSSAIYLRAQSPSVAEIVEYYEFTTENFVADIGSYLGLFLGWSMFSVLSDFINWLTAKGEIKTDNEDVVEHERNQVYQVPSQEPRSA